jgi:hypothetical protein
LVLDFQPFINSCSATGSDPPGFIRSIAVDEHVADKAEQ